MKLRKTILHDDGCDMRLTHWGGVSGFSEDWGVTLGRSRHIFCLNFGGDLMILQGEKRIHLVGQMIGSFRAAGDLTAATMATSRRAYDFLVLEVSSEWISDFFRGGLGGEAGNYVRWWEEGSVDRLAPARVLTQWEHSIYSVIQSPPEDGLVRDLWIHAQIRGFMSLQVFRKDRSLFCVRQKDVMKTRVASTLLRLREDLDQPLDLAGLAERASLTATSLSRLISSETGKTLSRHLRSMRVERALQLITEEKCSVTEAAFEVGYSSLSHFTKAFMIETGRKPSDFL
ncbi:helix-turn-helix domain-containing protein [Luteolibacter sp. AS25]|uniref:helix-turn-helix domain-containing protein n=1 Tax=Luteolibacter sp. AS25 TaxID=3135776 RepID=UPI00398B0BD7